jgi:hypothetical protein
MGKLADDFELAYSGKAPIIMSGPIVAHEENCQYPQISPLVQMRKSADDLESAHCCK